MDKATGKDGDRAIQSQLGAYLERCRDGKEDTSLRSSYQTMAGWTSHFNGGSTSAGSRLRSQKALLHGFRIDTQAGTGIVTDRCCKRMSLTETRGCRGRRCL